MRLHPGVAAPCRALVGGFGSPGCRDLDFGERFVRLAESLDWPDGVVVEDLSYSAHLVLHRLQELRPARVVLVGAVARGLDPPGTVRRYRVDRPSSPPEEVHGHLTEAIGGRVGLDNMLAVVGHFGGLPADTTVVEVEAADSSFGLGFSDELAAAIDPLLDAVREELGDMHGSLVAPALAAALRSPPAVDPTSTSPGRAPGGAAADAAPPGIDQLFRYAEAHAQVRALKALPDRLPTVPGLALAARFLPAGNSLGLTGDWYEALPRAGGSVALVMADVAGARRVQAATVAAQLKMAVRALALLEGDRPARLVGHLDRLVAATGVGNGSTLAYLIVDPADATVRLAGAGHVPPLVVGPGGRTSFVEAGGSPALGLGGGTGLESVVAMEPGSTLVLFTDGLVSGRGATPDDGRQRLRAAAGSGPRSLEGLCDHLVESCIAGGGAAGEDDVSLLAVRILD